MRILPCVPVYFITIAEAFFSLPLSKYAMAFPSNHYASPSSRMFNQLYQYYLFLHNLYYLTASTFVSHFHCEPPTEDPRTATTTHYRTYQCLHCDTHHLAAKPGNVGPIMLSIWNQTRFRPVKQKSQLFPNWFLITFAPDGPRTRPYLFVFSIFWGFWVLFSLFSWFGFNFAVVLYFLYCFLLFVFFICFFFSFWFWFIVCLVVVVVLWVCWVRADSVL